MPQALSHFLNKYVPPITFNPNIDIYAAFHRIFIFADFLWKLLWAINILVNQTELPV